MTALATAAIISGNQAEIRLQLTGAFNADNVAAWRTAFETVAASNAKRVVLDMSAVSAMDGSGLGAISFLFKRLMSRGRKLVVSSVAGQPLKMLTELGLASLLSIETAAARPAAGRGWFAGRTTARA